MGEGWQIAFDPFLMSTASSFCEMIQASVFSSSPCFSLALSRAPFGPASAARAVQPPVLAICVDEGEALLGPLYIPGTSVCPDCLEHWLDLNFYDRKEPEVTPGAEAAQAVAKQLAMWSSILQGGGRVEELEAGAVSLRFRDRTTRWRPVFPLRNCVRCASLRVEANTQLRVHCGPWTGIVNRMELGSSASAGAYRAACTWTPPLPTGNARPYLKRMGAYGRGRTREEAELGCVGEALERYSLIYRGDEPLVRAGFRCIDAIHPDSIQLFSESQYRQRHEWNAAADEEFHVPEPFQPDAPVDWLEARPLGRKGDAKFVAAGCCLMWYQFPPGETEFARADTVGCGCGPTFDDALAHALLEWIERDAMAIWWDNRLRRPGVRLDSFESDDLDQAAKGLHAIGRDLFLLDCTTDIGVPAYVSVAPRLDGSEPLLAGAAHPSARIAAYKAASEVGQVWYEAKKSGALPRSLRPWLLRETTATQPYLAPRGFVDAPRQSVSPREDMVRYIVECLESVGLQVYAVDHSRPDVLPRTARAIVPGLRHIWNRRAPGRLYDVPLKMGWLAQPHCEEDLNPVRCMI